MEDRDVHLEVVVVTRDRSNILRTFALDGLSNLAKQSIATTVIDQSAGRETEDILAQFPRIQYVRSKTSGLSQGRNHALAIATADIVAFTDDDVILHAGWAESIRAAFRTNPTAAAVLGRGRRLDGTLMGGARNGCYKWPANALSLGSGYSMALNREIALGIGGFDEAYGAGNWIGAAEDTDMFLRLLQEGHSIVCDDNVYVGHPEWRARPTEAWRQFRYGRGAGTVAASSLLRGDFNTVEHFRGKLAQRSSWMLAALTAREWTQAVAIAAYFVGTFTVPESLAHLAARGLCFKKR